MKLPRRRFLRIAKPPQCCCFCAIATLASLSVTPRRYALSWDSGPVVRPDIGRAPHRPVAVGRLGQPFVIGEQALAQRTHAATESVHALPPMAPLSHGHRLQCHQRDALRADELPIFCATSRRVADVMRLAARDGGEIRRLPGIPVKTVPNFSAYAKAKSRQGSKHGIVWNRRSGHRRRRLSKIHDRLEFTHVPIDGRPRW